MEEEIRLRILVSDNGTIEIAGNRAGLSDLAETCKSLSQLSDEDARTGANHYHFSEFLVMPKRAHWSLSFSLNQTSESGKRNSRPCHTKRGQAFSGLSTPTLPKGRLRHGARPSPASEGGKLELTEALRCMIAAEGIPEGVRFSALRRSAARGAEAQGRCCRLVECC